MGTDNTHALTSVHNRDTEQGESFFIKTAWWKPERHFIDPVESHGPGTCDHLSNDGRVGALNTTLISSWLAEGHFEDNLFI